MNVTGSGAVDPRVASIVPTLYTYNKTKSTITQLDMESCEYDKHFSKKMYEPLMKGINVSEYSCISNNTKNLSLIYNRTEQSGQYIILYMRTCVNSTENNNYCYTKNEIDNALTNSIFYFSYLVGSISIDHYNKSEPVKPSVYTQDNRMSYTSRSDLNIFWKPVLYKTDKGWLFEKNSKKNYFQIDENSFRQTMVTDKQKYSVNNSFSKTLFGLHYSTIDNYKRSYPKIQSVIANCSGLIKVSFHIAKFIVHMFTLGEYYSFLFDFDFNSSITINSVNNSVNNESKVELKKQGNAIISVSRSKVKNTVHNKKKFLLYYLSNGSSFQMRMQEQKQYQNMKKELCRF